MEGKRRDAEVDINGKTVLDTMLSSTITPRLRMIGKASKEKKRGGRGGEKEFNTDPSVSEIVVFFVFPSSRITERKGTWGGEG